ncbi:electron transfer flavoprotein subunit alpha/FixB family protein [Moorella sulfitireducens]|uniref:electron transfer flavoprotein subunit alpha/FixB family protein n=1 Tax=Neomoorella sulfitireducens TaxID=2972948 RepID=UPI0021ACB4D1|nr:electron transfer flavoprotein subunit alpha/FixB family protein [Moorella sulfitireducens]
MPADTANTGYRGVWVFIEQVGGEVAPVSWELLGAGRQLADALGVELAGVLLGQGVAGLVTEAWAYGADKVYLVEDPVLGPYRTAPYARALVQLVKEYKPEILLLGATSLGRDLSGAVATSLGTGLTADCTSLTIDPETRLLEQTRPAFGGNVMATILCRRHRPQMATVRPRVMPMPSRQEDRRGELVRVDMAFNEAEARAEVIEIIEEKNKAIYLDRAEIIVAGGRGVGSKENFRLLEELAGVLGGTLGASRAAVEAGWLPPEYQVGQTGTTVRPKVYFAIGISGAIQHLVGMQGADVIVAVNNDPQAPIFKIATYGIVGDFREVVPALTAEFHRQLAPGPG